MNTSLLAIMVILLCVIALELGLMYRFLRQEAQSLQAEKMFGGTPYHSTVLQPSFRPIDLSGVGFDQMKASVTERKYMAEIINDDTLLREAALHKTSDLDKNTFTGDDSYYRGMGPGGRKDFGPGSGN